jgi:hippurate hydrolase
VSVGSVHGGTKANIIPDDVRLQLSVRAYKPEIRDRVLASIERIARGQAIAAGVPEDHMPVVTVDRDEVAPVTYNQPELTERLAGVFKTTFGDAKVVKLPPIMGSEDFGQFALDDHKIPSVLFWLGGADPVVVDAAAKSGLPAPGLHSSRWAPPPELTIRTGGTAMTAALLDLLGTK